jgi:hypothetical protein
MPIPTSLEEPFKQTLGIMKQRRSKALTRMARPPAEGRASPWPFSQAQADLSEVLRLAASEGPQTIVLDGQEFLVTAQPKATSADIDFLIGGGPLDDE